MLIVVGRNNKNSIAQQRGNLARARYFRINSRDINQQIPLKPREITPVKSYNVGRGRTFVDYY